jgi:hypothetical protein
VVGMASGLSGMVETLEVVVVFLAVYGTKDEKDIWRVPGMGVIKARECQLHGCGLAAAGPAPNKKRLALCPRRPHRPHLTGRRNSPKSKWGAFSAPGSKAGEEGWKGGILGSLPESRIPPEDACPPTLRESSARLPATAGLTLRPRQA